MSFSLVCWTAVSVALGQQDAAEERAVLPVAERVEALEEQVDLLSERLERAEEASRSNQERIRVGGYFDVGFFVPSGNGSGIITDVGNRAFPEYDGRYGWVFLGDLYAPMVNSRGEAADLGDLPGADRFDSIHSRGAPGFLINEMNLNVVAGLTQTLLAQVSVTFVPRSGADFALGDFFHVDQAQLEWMPTESGKTSLFIGKFDSVIGIEYRDRRAAQRFGITPSLIQRYTSGTPVGIKARTKFFDDRLVVALSLTNGSSSVESFHFYGEIDRNAAKTLSGRISARPPLPWGLGLEIGVSGLAGAQDLSRASTHLEWFVGLDAMVSFRDFVLKAQWLRGRAPGSSSERVYGLDLKSGGYLEANWMFLPRLGVILRAEFRDAFVWLDDERAYLTKSWRGTLGVRAVLNAHLVAKAEYLFNQEFGGVPSIPNDIFTSSLVCTF
jgi:hypothetical protein